MRFIHIADVHLGRRPDVSFPWGHEREEELWTTFAAIAGDCRKKEADLLLIAGDLFDTPPAVEELKRANEILAGIAPTQVVLISGDCDFVRPGGAYDEFSWADNVHFLKAAEEESVYLKQLDTSVCGMSYRRSADGSRRLEDMRPDGESRYCILLAHGGDPKHLPFHTEELEKAGFDYVALGHEHQPRFLVPGNIAYAGSPEPLCKDEIGKHGYLLGELTQKGCRVSFVPVSVREYVSLKVRVSADIGSDELQKRLKAVMEKQGERNIYMITLNGKHALKQIYDRAALLALGNVVEVDDRTVPDYDLVALMDEHRDDVVGMYMEELLKRPSDPKVQRALYCGLEALLDQEETN